MSAIPTEIGQSKVDTSKIVRRRAQKVLDDSASDELIFAVVGAVGSGTSFVAKHLKNLSAAYFGLQDSDVVNLKASAVIEAEVTKLGGLIGGADKLERAIALQNAGDSLREVDEAAVGMLLVQGIKTAREAWELASKSAPTPIRAVSDLRKINKVFIIDSLKHPAEVELLRAVYREAFCLVGVVCENKTRERRLSTAKLVDSGVTAIQKFMLRDEDGDQTFGQKVSDTFHLSDFFVDNTPDQLNDEGQSNKDWVVPEKLGRLVDILLGEKIVRPYPSETGMFHAQGAQLRSMCLSRQVGAALTDSLGNLISTGTNEVPQAGGGVYGGGFSAETLPNVKDDRCAITRGYCSNNRVQDEIMDEVISAVPELQAGDPVDIKKKLKGTALGRLLEFSRAVHAEMDALLTAARIGASTAGAKLFVTTFPCHYCARHLVSAGVDEVQYIEPYPKSRALELHSDAIDQIFTKWVKPPPAKPTTVLFRAFTGVAPRLYRRAFMKDRKLKNSEGVLAVGKPSWPSGLLVKSYKQIESELNDEAS